MAGAKAKTQPPGSAGWIQSEREQAGQFVEQEAEEFSFSVRNELEWLNEHMAEIFSKNQVNFADVFKTPGKLRGKTPRTARKQNVLGPRQPLSDIFAPNVPAPPSAQKTAFFDKVAQFHIAEDDAENQPPSHRPASRGKSPQRVGKQINTDSGYHGMLTEDEMELDNRTETATLSSQQSVVQKVPVRENQPPPQRLNQGMAEAGNNSDDSFLSAKEDMTSRNVSKEQLRAEQDSDNAMIPDDEMEVDQQIDKNLAPETTAKESEAEPEPTELDEEEPSDVSSPGKPLQRKSSFTFTSLPPRDPTKSIGARNSQIDAQTSRNSTLARSFGAKSFGVPQNEEEEYVDSKSEESKAHNKTSTQLLQERINMLGKTKEPRPSKSLHQTVLGGQAAYPQLPAAEPTKAVVSADDSEDDWIAPTKPPQAKTVAAVQQQSETKEDSPERPRLHQKSISTTQIPSPSRPEMAAESRHLKAISVSNPSLANVVQSTTPAGSPMHKKHHDGPLSASKNKLYSVLKSAKSIFASSASASAAAKLEAHNNSPSRSHKRDISDESKTAAVFNMPGALYSDAQIPQSPMGRPISIISAISTSPSRKTRSSNESEKKREKDLKAQQKAENDLEKAREKERVKAAKQQEERTKAEKAEAAKKEKEASKQQAERPISAGSDKTKESEMPPPPPPKSMLPPGKLKAPARIGKPSAQQPQPSRPALIKIGVPSQSTQRLHQPSSSFSLNKSQHESSAPQPPPKQTGGRPGSAQGGSVRSSTAPQNNRLKALEAAARKKDLEDKAAQKKLEQKRELERKRAAKAEEERRAEEDRKVAEQQRLQEAKLAAQRQAEKQAAEAKRREQQRAEQQRQQEEAQKAKAAHELAEAIKRERAQQQPSHPRGDVGGTLRQLVNKNTVMEPASSKPLVQPNPAKPAKRLWVPEDEEPVHHQPQRPGLQRGPPSYQQHDAKRRRTDEEEKPEERHSVMAPPKRASTMRKESTVAKFPHGYTPAPPPTNPYQSMVKTALMTQHEAKHAAKSGMPNHPSQFSNGRIPFAEHANPPGTAQHHGHGQQTQHPGHENIQPGSAPQNNNNKFKTPARLPHQAQKSAAKSSPLYPNGDNIQLPDIATDSEDEEDEDSDSENNTGFRAPSWVASPALKALLNEQQLWNPETVFGPIGELKMEEVFRNGKNAERLKKFRDRSSSAAWHQHGDAVTSAEKRRDMELRERVVREGGWRYEPNV